MYSADVLLKLSYESVCCQLNVEVQVKVTFLVSKGPKHDVVCVCVCVDHLLTYCANQSSLCYS